MEIFKKKLEQILALRLGKDRNVIFCFNKNIVDFKALYILFIKVLIVG